MVRPTEFSVEATYSLRCWDFEVNAKTWRTHGQCPSLRPPSAGGLFAKIPLTAISDRANRRCGGRTIVVELDVSRLFSLSLLGGCWFCVFGATIITHPQGNLVACKHMKKNQSSDHHIDKMGSGKQGAVLTKLSRSSWHFCL